MDKWMYEWMNEWINGCMNRHGEIVIVIVIYVQVIGHI